jgi:hypothetical protein
VAPRTPPSQGNAPAEPESARLRRQLDNTQAEYSRALRREAEERKRAEEAERKAKEEAERKAREEAKRAAAEEAKRKAREEAERKAREEAKRAAAEEAERVAAEEAERAAAEKEEAARKAKRRRRKTSKRRAESENPDKWTDWDIIHQYEAEDLVRVREAEAAKTNSCLRCVYDRVVCDPSGTSRQRTCVRCRQIKQKCEFVEAHDDASAADTGTPAAKATTSAVADVERYIKKRGGEVFEGVDMPPRKKRRSGTPPLQQGNFATQDNPADDQESEDAYMVAEHSVEELVRQLRMIKDGILETNEQNATYFRSLKRDIRLLDDRMRRWEEQLLRNPPRQPTPGPSSLRRRRRSSSLPPVPLPLHRPSSFQSRQSPIPSPPPQPLFSPTNSLPAVEMIVDPDADDITVDNTVDQSDQLVDDAEEAQEVAAQIEHVEAGQEVAAQMLAGGKGKAKATYLDFQLWKKDREDEEKGRKM